jgi:hypothetical protein
VKALQPQRANTDVVPVAKREIRIEKWMGCDPGLCHVHGPQVSIRVVGMAVRADHVRYSEPLLRCTAHELLGRIGRIDENSAPGGAISEQVPEVPVTTGADLFEYQLHGTPTSFAHAMKG